MLSKSHQSFSIPEIFIRSFVLLSIFLVAACTPAQTPLPTATPQPPTSTPPPTDTPQPPTPTPSPTNTPEPPTPTNTPTPLPTDTSTPTFTPISLISMGAPPNSESFEEQVALIYEMDMAQRDTVTKNIQNTEPVSKCPSIWVETLSKEKIPTYLVYISISAPQEDSFMVAIHQPRGLNPSGYVSLGVTLPGSGENIVVVAKYQPPSGQPTPDEYEIRVVFSGCEIYTVVVPWP